MIERAYICHCDTCKESCEYITTQSTRKGAINCLIHHGWKHKNEKLICPDCSPNLNKESQE